MKSTRPAAAPHAAPVRLWVEDVLTKQFLQDLWQDTDIDIKVSGGGRKGVDHMVHADQQERRIRHVYGFVDRDFSPNDSAKWANPDYRIFRTTAHEMENHLLDFDALGRLAGRAAQDVQNEAHTFARRLRWWTACKATLDDLRKSLQRGFPSDPNVPKPHQIFGEPDAVAHIETSGYWKGHAAALAQEGRPHCIAARVAYHGDVYDDALNDDSWVTLFSGKEIFRHLRSHVAGLDTPAPTTGRLTSAQRDEDLGRRIATYYRSHTSPGLFVRLHAELRRRAGL